MITIEQAKQLHYGQHVHVGQCTRTIGKRGAAHTKIVEVKINGAPKTWKRQPDKFSVPFKYGLYQYGYITNDNAADFHLASECNLLDTHQFDDGVYDKFGKVKNWDKWQARND